ncbi:unnamed protein product [Prunus armeniaca]
MQFSMRKVDKALLSLLIATLSDEAIEYVIRSKTTFEAWMNLTDRYATLSSARVNLLKTKLQTAKKGTDSIEKFLLHLKHVRDQLAVGPPKSGIVPECQFFSKRGHIATNCFFRNFTPSQGSSVTECKICGKKGHGALDCYHRSNYAYQGSPPPSSLTAMAAQASFSPDAVWIADSGASHHVVPHMTTMHNVTPCNSAENVVVGSGEGLHIAHIGKSHIPTVSSSLNLFKVTNKMLLQGKSDHGLYLIPTSLSSVGSSSSSSVGASSRASQSQTSAQQHRISLTTSPCYSSTVLSPIPVMLTTSATSPSVPASHSSSSAPSITPPELLASLELFQPEPYILVLSEQQLQVLLPSIDSISSFSTASVQPSVPVESAPVGPSHSMLTRSKTGVVKKKDFSDYKCYTSIHDTTFMDEPSSYRVASFSADWTKAIDEEISAL